MFFHLRTMIFHKSKYQHFYFHYISGFCSHFSQFSAVFGRWPSVAPPQYIYLIYCFRAPGPRAVLFVLLRLLRFISIYIRCAAHWPAQPAFELLALFCAALRVASNTDATRGGVRSRSTAQTCHCIAMHVCCCSLH